MSGVSIEFDVRSEGVSAQLQTFIGGLRSKLGLHRAISDRQRNLTRDHLIGIAQTRHATAQRLGASPSGHWAQAADKTHAKATGEAAVVTVSHPGIGRAFRDVTIKPTAGKTYLTIPLVAEAYNQRAYRMRNLFFLRAHESGAAFLARDDGAAGVKVMYLLVKSVRQKQDRTLLPSDAQYQQAALEGARDYADYLLTRSTGGAPT